MTAQKLDNLKKTASFTLGELAATVNGQLLDEYAQLRVHGVGTIEHAREGEICFLENAKYQKFLEGSQASAVLIPESMSKQCQLPMIVVENPKLAFAHIMRLIYPEKTMQAGVHASVIQGKNTSLHPSVFIGPNCVLGDNVVLESGVVLKSNVVIGDNCKIGANTHLHSNVTLYSGITVGKNNLIHSGVVLGGDGFGFACTNNIKQGNFWVKIPHIGGVILGNDVEVGANTTIDRGVIEDTVIEDGVIIDNLVQIAHNVHIGAYTAIAACVGIAGSAKIGRYCQIGGGSIINGHITITDHSYFIGGSQVGNSIKKPGVYSSGIPAKEYAQWAKNVARFHHLDELADRVKALEKKLKTEDL